MLFSLRKYLASFLLVLLFLGLAGLVSAKDLEIIYPQIGDLAPPRTTQTLLPDYVKYIFNFAIAISGLIVFGVIFYSGFRLITEAQNPSAMSEAKTKITDAFIGLIILLGSYLFLTTINPQLALINPEIKGGNQGIILYAILPSDSNFNAAENQKTITVSQDLKDFPNAKFYQFSTDPNFVKAWVNSNVELLSTKDGIDCFKTACALSPSSPQSIKIEYQFPGVYLCKADKSCYFTSRSFNEFPSNIIRDYEDQITYIKFKNTYAYDSSFSPVQCLEKQGTYFAEQKTCGYPSIKYGAVLHEGRNYTSTCKEFFTDSAIVQGQTNVFPGPAGEGVSSITVFVQPNESPDPTKGGVTLYKLENFAETDIAGKKIFWPQDKPAQGNYSNLENSLYEDKKRVAKNVLSLKIDGNYLALLFQNVNFQNKCEVVSANDFDLGVDNPVGDEVSSLKVIPAQK